MFKNLIIRAKNISFNKRGTGLNATNVQDAIKEICTDYVVKKTSVNVVTGDKAKNGAMTIDIHLDGYTPYAIVGFGVVTAPVDDGYIRCVRIQKNQAIVSYDSPQLENRTRCEIWVDVLYKKSK